MRLLTMLVALGWIAGVAWFGWTSLPQLPLDVSASDPATLEALNAARMRHGAVFAAIALLPAIALVLVGRLLTRAR
jgi:hypothetical protein